MANGITGSGQTKPARGVAELQEPKANMLRYRAVDSLNKFLKTRDYAKLKILACRCQLAAGACCDQLLSIITDFA